MSEELNNMNVTATPALKDYKVTPLFERKSSDILMAFCLILLSIFGVSSFFWDWVRLGYTLVFNLSVIVISAFIFKKGIKPTVAFLFCGVLSLICSWTFAVTSNALVKAVAFIVTAISAVIWFASLSGKKYKAGDVSLIEYTATTVINVFGDLPAIIKSFFAKNTKKSKKFTSILIGIVCAIPALAVIIPLLLKSDEAFYSLIHILFDDLAVLLQKIIIGLIASVFVIGLVFSIKYNSKEQQNKGLNIKTDVISVFSFLCVISFVYIVYLFSQLAYFFSAFSSILPKDYKFTYAQYARRGFFELCIISAINLAIAFAVIVISEKQNGKLPVLLRIPSAFIAVFTMLIIFTAISKMFMYINAYGLTVMRICTSAFMIWILILFIGVLVRLFIKQADILVLGLLSALIIVSVLGLSNINLQTARYNYNAYVSGKLKIDVEYIASLGDEGIPYLYKLTKDRNSETVKIAKNELSWKYSFYYDTDTVDLKSIKSYKQFKKLEKQADSIGKYSLSNAKAYKYLDKYAKETNGKIYAEYEW